MFKKQSSRARVFVVSTMVMSCLAARNVSGQEPPYLAPAVASTPWDSAKSGWTGRLVVGEYVTGILCGICQVHDEMFNALLRRYPRTVFISLGYHEPISVPFGDPVDSVIPVLWNWYGLPPGFSAQEHPPLGRFHATGFDDWIDGISMHEGQKEKEDGSPSGKWAADYGRTMSKVDEELKRPPEAFFHVQSVIQGGRLLARIKVDSVTGPHPKVLLRLILVEDTAYVNPDNTGYHMVLRREHHMVVHGWARTKTLPMALPLQVPGTVQYTFDVAGIQRRHLRYYREGGRAMSKLYPTWYVEPNSPDFMQDFSRFLDEKDWRMNGNRLHVVAFVEDAHTGEVLQTAMVPAESNGKRLALP